jgi:hypothetical protein
VVLLLEEDLSEMLAKGELIELVGLADAAAVVANGFALVVEVEAEHVLGLLAGLDGFGGDGGHAAEVVDLVGEDEGVGKLFLGMDLKLAGDVHVSRTFEDLGVVDVGDDGLEFALQVLVELVNQLLAGDGFAVFRHDGDLSLSGADCCCLDPFEMRGERYQWPAGGRAIAFGWGGIQSEYGCLCARKGVLMRALYVAVLGAGLALPLVSVAQEQQTTTTITPTQTTETTRTTTTNNIQPMTKSEMKAQRNEQKVQENSAKNNSKAAKERSKALIHQDKATIAAEKAQSLR